MTTQLTIVREMIKHELRKHGTKISHFDSATITKAAKELLQRAGEPKIKRALYNTKRRLQRKGAR